MCSGIDWWNVVSNTATDLEWGRWSRHAFITARAEELCLICIYVGLLLVIYMKEGRDAYSGARSESISSL